MEEEGIPHPSYFEFLFGMGLSAFEKSDVEYIVLETGLGGKTGCNQCISVSGADSHYIDQLDHTMILGNTIEQIAAEKAGIIKEGTPVIFDGNDEQLPRLSEIRRKSIMRHVGKSGKMRSKSGKLPANILHFHGQMLIIKMLSGKCRSVVSIR